MVEFRWLKVRSKKPVLQVRHMFRPVMVASGDVVLYANENPHWEDVPTSSGTPLPSNAYNDKAAREEFKRKYPNAELSSL